MSDLLSGWTNHGRLLRADGRHDWFSSHASSMWTYPGTGSEVRVVFTARDPQNRSSIGRGVVDLEHLDRGIEIEPEPILTSGGLGCFDENGVSYPFLVEVGGRRLLYYTGWRPTVLTPFDNQLGLAVERDDGTFVRTSRAPVLPQNDIDHLCIGSTGGLVHEGALWLWYTSFVEWTRRGDRVEHSYIIRRATSYDGEHFERDGWVCIGAEYPGEHSICHPTVLQFGDGRWHMWYSTRGDRYRFGYAVSDDGLRWSRLDDDLQLPLSGDTWDDQEQCYPHAFVRDGRVFLMYAGNDHGDGGIGVMSRPVP